MDSYMEGGFWVENWIYRNSKAFLKVILNFYLKSVVVDLRYNSKTQIYCQQRRTVVSLIDGCKTLNRVTKSVIKIEKFYNFVNNFHCQITS